MVSFDRVLALTYLSEDQEEPQKPTLTRTRHDWARGDVRCLLCERLIGRLLGSRNCESSRGRASGAAVSFFAYRSADTSHRVAAFRPGMSFRCTTCGGSGALDDVEFFATYDEVPLPAEDDEPIKRGRGRPPRRRNRAEPAPAGLAAALATLTGPA
jgi:hypothetical protein